MVEHLCHILCGMATTTLKKWSESTLCKPESIDREAGVIRGVKIIGHESRNRRNYDDRALSEAIPLYENAKVYIDHPGKGAGDRSMKDRWGVLKNVRKESSGLYGDLHYLKSHKLTEQILEAAERFPDTFGLSHNASGEERKIGGRNTVVAIESVYSVDLVGDPATNKGLFESTTMNKTVKQICEAHTGKVEFVKALQEMYGEDKLAEMDGYDPSAIEVPVEESMDAAGEVSEAFKAIFLSILNDESLDNNAKLSKIRIIMKAQATVNDAVNSADVGSNKVEEDEEEDSEMEESLKRATDENKKLTEELELLKTKVACEKLLRESNREVSDVRVAALVAVKESDRKPLVESWASIGASDKKRPSASPSRFTESASTVEYPKDQAAFKQFLRS